MLGIIREPIMFILLLFERIQKIPRREPVAKTRSPIQLEKIMLKIINIVIIKIVRYL